MEIKNKMEFPHLPKEFGSILEQKAKASEARKEKSPVTFVEDTLKGEFVSIYGVCVDEIVDPGVYFDVQGNRYIKE